MPFENKFNKIEGNNKKFNKKQEKNVVSKEWLFIDKRENNETTCSCSPVNINCSTETDEKLHVSNVLSKLRPFIPLSIEEASLTNNLENWSNCNVRLMGVLKYSGNEGDYYLESVNEPDGTYKIILDFKNAEQVPLLNECIQVFGKINVDLDHANCIKPFVSVSFFRNMESGNFLQYMEAVEKMKLFVPLFIKTTNYSSARNYDDDDDFVCNYNIME